MQKVAYEFYYHLQPWDGCILVWGSVYKSGTNYEKTFIPDKSGQSPRLKDTLSKLTENFFPF